MRDDFTEDVKRTLAASVGNVCSNPDCRALTSDPQDDDPAKALDIDSGVAVCITGAAPGAPRHSAALSAEQRCHPDNGLWLCQTCAKLVDNDAAQYPEDLLRAWKTVAEHRARSTITKTASSVSTALPPSRESESRRKASAILLWKGKIVTLSQRATGEAAMSFGPNLGYSLVRVLECTENEVTIGRTGAGGWSRSISLESIVLRRDVTADQLELQVRCA